MSRKKRNLLMLIVAIILVAVLGAAAVLLSFEAYKEKQQKEMKVSQMQKAEEKKKAQKGEKEEPVLTEEELRQLEVEKILKRMTLEEKVAQMFVVTPESLTGVGVVISAGDATKAAIEQYPVGGIIYFSQNLENPEQVREMLTNTQNYSMERIGLPMILSVDEEGGTVTRISGKPEFGVPDIGDMSAVGATGNPQNAYQTGVQIGTYLKDLGFNTDFAPVADVLTNPANTVVQYRSFGTDCNLVTDMVLEELRGLKEQNITGVLKHFPGHGATEADTHNGYAYTESTLEQMKSNELVPFIKGIEAGADMIMAAHISCPNITGDHTPTSLSGRMINEILRGELGYQGVVITDGMHMGAVAESYTPEQATLAAIQAGVDLILMPADFYSAYQGVLNAVQSGVITEERIDESLRRILDLKLQM